MVDVVAKCLLLAATQVCSLLKEALVGPVLVEGQRLLDVHSKDQESSALSARTAGSDDPISECGRPPDSGLARRECAHPVERIRSEAEVAGHDVGVDRR